MSKNPNPYPTSPFHASTIEERIDAAQRDAQQYPDQWVIVEAPVSYNRYNRLLKQNSAFDYEFDAYDDAVKTPNGNSSGSRLGAVRVYFSSERNPQVEQPTLQPTEGAPIDWDVL